MLIEEIIMANTARTTPAKSGRTTVTRREFNSLKSDVASILTLLEAQVTPAAAPKAAKKATSRKTVAKKAAPKASAKAAKCVTRKTRAAFVKANPQFAGQSTAAIQRSLHEGASFEGNFTLGERTVAFLETGSYPESAPKAEATPKRTRKGAKKATRKPAAKRVKAAVKAEAPAKVTEPVWGTPEWIAATHPREKDTPRRADGKPTPKSEWPLRIALEASGQFDRYEVDAVVAKG